MRTAATLGRRVVGARRLATVAAAATALLPALSAALLSGCSGAAALPGPFKWRSAARAATPQPERPVMPLMQVQARMVYPQAITTVGAAVGYLLEPHSYRPAYAGAPAVAERALVGNYAADPVPLFVAMQRLMGRDGRIVVDEDRRLYVLQQRQAGEAAVAFAALAPPSAPYPWPGTLPPPHAQAGVPAPVYHGAADPLSAGAPALAPPHAGQAGVPALVHPAAADPLSAGNMAVAPPHTPAGVPAPAYHGVAGPLSAGATAVAPPHTGPGGAPAPAYHGVADPLPAAAITPAPPSTAPLPAVAALGNIGATGSAPAAANAPPPAPSGGAYFMLPDVWSAPPAMPPAHRPDSSVAVPGNATAPSAMASPAAPHVGQGGANMHKAPPGAPLRSRSGNPPPALVRQSAVDPMPAAGTVPPTASLPAHRPASPVAPRNVGATGSASGDAHAPPPGANTHFLLSDSRSARHHGANKETSPKKRENNGFSAKIGTQVLAAPPPQVAAPAPAHPAASRSQPSAMPPLIAPPVGQGGANMSKAPPGAPPRSRSGNPPPVPVRQGAANPMAAAGMAPPVSASDNTGAPGSALGMAPPTAVAPLPAAHNPAPPVAAPGAASAIGSAPSMAAAPPTANTHFLLSDAWGAGHHSTNRETSPKKQENTAFSAKIDTKAPAGPPPQSAAPVPAHLAASRSQTSAMPPAPARTAANQSQAPALPPAPAHPAANQPQAVAPAPARLDANQSQAPAMPPAPARTAANQSQAPAMPPLTAPLPSVHRPASPVAVPSNAGATGSAPGDTRAPTPIATAPKHAAHPVKNRSACRSIRFVDKAMLSEVVRSYFLACGFSEVAWRLGAPGRYADYRLSHDLDVPLPGGYEDLVELLHTRFGIKARVHDHNRIDFHDDKQNLL